MFGKIKRWYHRRQLKTAIEVLRKLESIMKRSGCDRNTRRRVWREMAKDQSSVIEVLNDVYKSTGPSDGGGV